MSESQNTQTVKDAYAAFLRGDVNAILDMLADEVEWEGVKGGEGVVPQAGLRRGKPAIAQFFSQVGANIAFDTFEPREFVAQGDHVVAIGSYSGKAIPTGGTMASDWVMVFNFRDGKIARFREFTDSAQLVRAFAGVTV